MNKILVVVDMQNDFIDGALGTPEAQAIVEKVAEKVGSCQLSGGTVVYTADTHGDDYLETQEGRNLPVKHCIKGTQGWQIACAVKGLNQTNVYEKTTFGSRELAESLASIHKNVGQIDEIELVGLCTDICVISNALVIKAFLPEVKITVDASCCAGVTPESHATALAAMKMCQINVING